LNSFSLWGNVLLLVPSRDGQARRFAIFPSMAARMVCGAHISSPLFDQFYCELNIVEDLAVKCDPKPPVHGGHRLAAAIQVDDAQPCMSQSGGARNVDADCVRTAVAYGSHAFYHCHKM
jgi:hypothetical protein